MTRRCREPGCVTILSSYNPDPKCFLHALPQFSRGLSEDQRQRRVDQLAGKYPEDLKWSDGMRYAQCRVPGCDEIADSGRGRCRRHYEVWQDIQNHATGRVWDAYRETIADREPKDVMEA